MAPDSRDLYFGIHEYIHQLVGDMDVSLRLVNVFIKAEIPLQTFITAAKLYRIVLNRANTEKENVNFIKKKNSTGIQSSCISRDKDLSVDKSKYIGMVSGKLINCPYATFVSCCVISSKFYKDIAFNNESWGGISLLNRDEINKFERDTLSVLDYKINSAGDSSVMKDVQMFLDRSMVDTVDRGPEVFDFKCFIKKLFCFS